MKSKEIGMKQRKGVIVSFDEFFKKEKFDNIAEIGTGSGNFSIYLAKKAKDISATFVTFDIRDILGQSVKNRLTKLGGIFLKEDINKSIAIENLLRGAGRVLILNDGALKLPQFKRFSPLLKNGDCLMTHDYYISTKYRSVGRITLGEVIHYIQKDDLRISYENIFEKFIWLCCIKD
jgi:hypothetical protein